MEERKLLGIMICVYTDLRDSNIFHPLFTLKAQTKYNVIFWSAKFFDNIYLFKKNPLKQPPKPKN